MSSCAVNRQRRNRAVPAISGLLALLALLLAPAVARAFHDQGYECYRCHSLKPSDIRAGSNAIRLDQTVLTPIPVSPSGQTAWTGGMPITCDFCHRATDDVPMANFASKTYHHPVRTISDNGAVPNEIACGDCHRANLDVVPQSMTTKSATDGYPDHDNVTAGYAHNLTSNPPHLTVPYWSSLSLPGATRANDTAFWTNVRGGTQDIVCWVCHEGAGRTNAPTRGPMTNRISTMLVKGDYTGAGRARGHQMRTNAGGSQLGVGAALPCYDCHDSHGSMSRAFILDNQSIYGSSTSQVATTQFTGVNDPVVCAQCHDTGNATTLSTKASGDGKQVEGVYPVDPYNSAVYSTMHVDSGTTDNLSLSSRNCLANNGGCHATPHNPIGESTGGLNCSVCHLTIVQAMDNGTSSGYHHVIMADNAPLPGAYPSNATPTGVATDRTCTMCHVDHSLFSPQVIPSYLRGRNLRRDITLQPDNLTNAPLSTDYDNTLARGGICTSCHENRQTKRNPGTDIKNDGSTYTPAVSRAIFGASAHNYPTASPYLESKFRSDNTLFQSNCVKCHNDTFAKRFQDNTTWQFSLHASDGSSAVNKLLAPLGYTPLTDNLSENFCYRCHSHSTDGIAGSRKTVDARDWYNNRAMSVASEDTWASFQKASRHPVAAADQAGGTRVVDCVNCHNVHLVGRPSDNTVVSNPDNTYASVAGWHTDGTGPAAQSAFCLTCHDGAPPAYQLSTNVYVPAGVRVSSADMDKTAYAARAHWTDNQGQIFNTAGVACTTCHDKHGGTFGKLLDNSVRYHGVPVTPSGLCTTCHGFSAVPVASGNNNTYCFRCHTQDQGESPNGYPPTEADRSATDNGYFSLAPTSTRFAVRWPGRAAYEGSYSPHASSPKTFAGFDTVSRPVGSCNTCHDVHGTANVFNELRDTFRAGNYTFCFRCHGASGSPAGTDNIAPYYATIAGGAATDCSATTNVGHNVRTAGGYLPRYANLPCYDCHGIHGSASGNTQLKSDQRWSGLGNTKYGSTPSDNAADNASRIFCLGCHVASDDGATAGTVENLQRQTAGTNRLKLPTAAADNLFEHTAASTQGCQRCHYGYTYLDNTFGPHYPGTGLCDTCHESQGTRSSASATYNGAHRTHTDNVLYKFACKQCHSWTATVSKAVHKNDNAATQHAEVRFDNQATSGWGLIQYGTVTQYEYRSLYASPYAASAPSPGYTPAGTDNATADGRRPSVRWTNGTCANVWCHSNANPVTTVQGALGVSNVYQGPAWLDNALRTDCTGCHGGDRGSTYPIGDNATALNGSIAHRKHVAGNFGCSKCHYATVATSNNRQIDNLVSHVNGTKDVVFSPEVGGTWDNATKTCSATYCHGTPAALPEWDNLATVTGCGVCHVNQGASSSPVYSGPHHPHTMTAKLRIACEACHANRAAAHDNAVHAGGPDNAASGQSAEIHFSDNAANQLYDGLGFLAKNMWLNPYDNNAAMSPAYAGGASSVGNDAVNPALHWTKGTCTNVWCHSNAKPLGWKGVSGQNAIRTASWDSSACTLCHNPRANDVNCTPCHRGRAAAATMAGADNLSGGHITHAATDRYNFTCDECHAWTVPNDSDGLGGLGIIAGTGHDNHVDGVKTVRFSTTLRTTGIDMSGGSYDNGAYRCYNTYCHSNGTDNGTFGTPAQWPRDNTIAWNSATGGTCATCHSYTAASGFPMTTQAHDNHVNNAATLVGNYACYRCHNATVNSSDNVNNYANHVNGFKDVAFSENAAWATYAQAPSRTCSNTFCHRQGNKNIPSGGDNLSIAWDCTVDTNCRTCHGSKAVQANYTYASKLGEPNYDNGFNSGVANTQNSHYKHMRLPGADNTAFCAKCHPDVSPTVVNALATDNWARHINDNVDVRGGNGASFTWDAANHRCGSISCHGGGTADWGAKLNCAGCHVSMGIENWTYNTGTHRAHTDNTQYRIACEACHAWKSTLSNVTHGNGLVGGFQYAEVRFSDNGSAQTYSTNPTAYYSDNMFGSWYARTWSPTYAAGGSGGADNLAGSITWSTGSCSNVYCHSNAGPLGSAAGAVVRTQPAWGATYGCNVCHSYRDNNTNMLGNDNNLSKVHAQHVATNWYNFTCYECHGSTVNITDNVAGYDNHVNGARNWKFSAAFRGSINQLGGSYSGSPNYQCTNLYCHSTGFDNGTFAAPLVTPRWDNAGNTGCAYCHGSTASSGSPIGTLGHDNHVNNAATLVGNYSCYRCHNATVGTDNQTITGYAQHVNGFKNVAFSENAAWAGYVNGTKTCSNTFCHRQGNKNIPSGGDNLSIAWDCTVDTNCRTCHGSKAVQANYAYASKLGEPNYDNGFNAGVANTQNSHYSHISSADNTTKCSKCHPDVSPTVVNALATDNWARHINDNVDVRGGNGASFTWDSANHRCGSISCHNNGSAVWGAKLYCYDCHTGTGDLDDFAFGANPELTMYGNGRTSRIDNTEWTTRGHGATAAYADGHPGAGFTGTTQCQYCHQPAYSHDNATNIFRLANYDYYGNGWNDVCLVCHRKTGGHAGYNGRNATTAFVDNAHYGTKHTTTYNGGKFCYDCHDPHGDNNIFMVAKQATMRTDNVYGIPYRTSIDDNQYRPGVAFLDNTSGANYADNVAPYNGICQVCHEAASTIKHFVNSGQIDTHFTTKCTICHLHDFGFKGMGGPDIEQYFDNAYNLPNATAGQENYDDRSRHPLTNGTTSASLLWGGTENCLGCHGAKYKSSGVEHWSNECLKCHFEHVSGSNPALDGTRHMNRAIELSTITNNNLPASQYAIATLANYDSWCLQCHGGTTITLGGVTPSAARGTYIDNAAFANGRHRTRGVGCIYCHQPHGRSNAMIVREGPQNRRSAGGTPMMFGVYPNDNTGSYGVPANQNLQFRMRQYWSNNLLPQLPEADDDQGFCNMACHIARLDSTYAKDKIILRNGTTGNYVLSAANRKIYVVNGVQYTMDNITNLAPNSHQHPNGDIIATDNMVDYYAGYNNISGPSYYKYPMAANAHPSSYNPASSDLPLTPDYADTLRDFTNAYNGLGVGIVYRTSCSACHDPHGNTLPNSAGGDGYPDLRLLKNNPNTLCLRCHK